jgi:hypothetical protein
MHSCAPSALAVLVAAVVAVDVADALLGVVEALVVVVAKQQWWWWW